MKASAWRLSWLGLFGRYVPVVVLAGVFGWLVGASNLISDDHMVVSIVAPTVAGMSVLGVLALAALVGFVSGAAPSLGIGIEAGRWPAGQSAVAPDEPSHIHIPRRPKGEGA